MTILAALLAAVFLTCGSTIAGVTLASDISVGAKVIGAVLGLIVACGAIPLVRAARRMRRRRDERIAVSLKARQDRKTVGWAAVLMTASALGLFFVPATGAKVAAIIDLCIVPIFLIWEFDPAPDKP